MAEAIRDTASDLNLNVEIEHLPNPRVEKEEHQMVMENDRFLSELLPDARIDIRAGIQDTLESLMPYRDVIVGYKDRFIPENLLNRVAVR